MNRKRLSSTATSMSMSRSTSMLALLMNGGILIVLTLLIGIGTTESFTTTTPFSRRSLHMHLHTNFRVNVNVKSNVRSSLPSLSLLQVSRRSRSRTLCLSPVVLFDSGNSDGDSVDTTMTNNDIHDKDETKDSDEHDEKDVTLSTSIPLGNTNNNTTTTATISTTATATATVSSSNKSKSRVQIPSYRTLLFFSSTTILIWLSEPLLSLVDTAVVGYTQPNAVVQLASLGPATTLTDSLLYLTYFLAIATTNQLAPVLAKHTNTNDYRQLQTTTSHVLSVAVVLGMMVTLIVFLFGTPLLTSMAGSSASAELVTCAVQYSQIRAAVAVSSVVGTTAQAFLLTVRDMRTPAIAVLAASLVNVVGDIGLRRYGVQGAAVATAAACVTSTAILLRKVRLQMMEWRRSEVLGLLSNSSSSNGDDDGSNSNSNAKDTTGTNTAVQQQRAWKNITEFEVAEMELDSTYHWNVDVLQLDTELAPATHQEVPFFSLPDRQAFIELVRLSGPIFCTMVAKIACYSAMTLRCTDFGVTALAAHNIMMRIFFFYGCFGDSLSQTAQTFLPVTLYPVKAPREFRQILWRLLCMAGVVGVFNSQTSVWMLSHLGGHLTKDVGIIRMMKDHTGFFGLAILLHPFIMVFEGAVIANRDFTNLIKTYLVTLALHFGVLKYASGSFPAVWRTFFLFQLTRLVNFGFRVMREQRRTIRSQEERENAAAATTTATAVL